MCSRSLIVFTACLAGSAAYGQSNAAKPFAENPFGGDERVLAEAGEIYNRTCTACHGKDGAAGDRAPALAAPARRYLRSSDRELFDAIKKGIPRTQMPPSVLSDDDAWKVVAYIRALRGTAIDAPTKGDVAHGEQIFMGKGGCSGCHLMHGKGGLTGPELSNIASQRKLISIQDALTKPQHIVPTDGGRHDSSLSPLASYRPVRVTTRGGQTISGILRNEDSFSLQVLGYDNALHMFTRDQVREVIVEPKSLMPTDYDKRLTPDDMQDLLAFLSRQGTVAAPVKAPQTRAWENNQ